ncbi:hypothetical protein [Vibrio gangliei]|uniref:hypothetical protein n=1 Tax=Vibrio gangliei TaxID=2077090 RepID=UPI000D016AE4|nr:hypothetical protein [Vibrio gangliei]
MNFYYFWCALTAQNTLNTLMLCKGNIWKTSVILISESMGMFVFVNTICLALKVAVLSSAHRDIFDALLAAYIAIQLVTSIKYMIDFRYNKEVYLLA